LTSIISRTALVAALAVGVGGLVAVPAASAADTQYYVNSPVVTGVSNLTPESVVLHGAVDTGGNPGIEVSEPAGTNFAWAGGVDIITTAAENIWIDGLPPSGSDNTVYIGSKSFSNGGADNYSDVEFELDPVSDYKANGDTAGPDTMFATSLQVPTQGGLTAVSEQVGAFGAKALQDSGQTPLKPNTEYYYWIIDQAGTTDAAENVNTGTAASPSYSCLPDAYVAAYDASDPVQGPCVYQFGNNSGVDFYQSPNGRFKTPPLGRLVIARSALVTGHRAMLEVKDASAFKASGVLRLEMGRHVVASAKFGLAPGGSRDLTLLLNARGVKAAAAHARVKLVLTSNWDQPTLTKQVRL
jgi:hypothetical protein